MNDLEMHDFEYRDFFRVRRLNLVCARSVHIRETFVFSHRNVKTFLIINFDCFWVIEIVFSRFKRSNNFKISIVTMKKKKWTLIYVFLID